MYLFVAMEIYYVEDISTYIIQNLCFLYNKDIDTKYNIVCEL